MPRKEQKTITMSGEQLDILQKAHTEYCKNHVVTCSFAGFVMSFAIKGYNEYKKK
jgi:hypothetical protein